MTVKTQNKKISIYLESNPNPNSLKFVVDKVLVPEGQSFDFPTPQSTHNAPLAQSLFMYPFVERVFYMSNFITVTKREDVDWLEVQGILRDHIQNFLESEKLILDQPEENLVNTQLSPTEESEVITKIKSILDEYVRPAVEQDGGAITFESFEAGILRVSLQGSCSGCPSSTVTLKDGIENLFRNMMPDEVKQVEALS